MSKRYLLTPALTVLGCSLAFGQDTCATATAIGDGVTPWAAGATASLEIACEGSEDDDLWFEWTAGSTADYTIDTCDSLVEDDTVLTIYASCADATAGICVTTGDDECGGSGFLSEATLTGVTAGDVFLIRVSDWVGGTPDTDGLDDGVLTIAALSPIGLACDVAEPITDEGTFFSAGSSTLSGAPACEGSEDDDYWFEWTAVTDGAYLFSTCDDTGTAEDDTVMTIYASCADAAAGSCLATGEDDCGTSGFLAEASLDCVLAGDTLLIRVSDWTSGTDTDPLDSFNLTVTNTGAPLPPANDECVGAEPIGGTGLYAFDTGCSTDSGTDLGAVCTGAVGANPNLIPNDVWFSWTAPSDGCFLISTCGLSDIVDTKIAVRNNGDCGTSVPIACNDDTTGCANFSSEVVLGNVTAGNSYLIQVGAWAGAGGGVGPFDQGAGMLSIDAAPSGVSSYCETGANGALMALGAGSTTSISNPTPFVLEASPVPDSFGLFYFGPGQFNIPFGAGKRCVGGGVLRLQPPTASTGGTATRAVDFASSPGDNITAGSCWNFQYWFRDTAQPSGFDLSDGLTAIFEL